MPKTHMFPFLFLLLSTFFTASAQNDPAAYLIFDKEGKQVSFAEMADQLSKADIVLFGELHNNPVIHWLQLELTEALYERNKGLILGAEMFEADDQIVVDEYFQGFIKHKHLTSEAKVWDNYETDYRPLLEFAREHQLPFIATNVPRRYASIVATRGLSAIDSLSDEAKRHMMPLPLKIDMNTPGYKEIGMMAHGHDTGSDNFVHAQAIKDATMAHFILRNHSKNKLFLHFNGDFHSKNYGGIYWYLKAERPKLKIMTISSIETEKMEFPQDQKNAADYILITPEKITKTY